jgi:hypothetical protein
VSQHNTENIKAQAHKLFSGLLNEVNKSTWLSCKFTAKFSSHDDNTRDPNVSFTWLRNFTTSIVTSETVLCPFHYYNTPLAPTKTHTLLQKTLECARKLREICITRMTHLRVSNFRDRIEIISCYRFKRGILVICVCCPQSPANYLSES